MHNNQGLLTGNLYSGPDASGICICGCSWESHHLSLILRPEIVEQRHEGYVPGECLRYGNNELGGMKFNDVTEEWEDHCHGYLDSKLYNAQTEDIRNNRFIFE